MAWTVDTNQMREEVVTSGTTVAPIAPMLNTPTVGDTIGVLAIWYGGGASGTTATCQDENGKTYTAVANSPSTYDTNAGQVFGFYRNVTGGEGQTPTVTFGNTIVAAEIYVIEATPPSGTATIDGAQKGTDSGAAVTHPTVPVSGLDRFLFCCSTCSGGITAVSSPWTAFVVFPGSIGSGCAYDLSAGAGTALNFTAGSSDTTSSLGMSFAVAGGGGGASTLWAASVM